MTKIITQMLKPVQERLRAKVCLSQYGSEQLCFSQPTVTLGNAKLIRPRTVSHCRFATKGHCVLWLKRVKKNGNYISEDSSIPRK